jgi:hypothetical protein
MRSLYCYLLRIVIPKLIKRYHAPTPHGGGVAVGLGSPSVLGATGSLLANHTLTCLSTNVKPISIDTACILTSFMLRP